MNNNKITINTYETSIKEYLNIATGEIQADTKFLINKSLSYINTNAKILEFGTGAGRDADYIENLGFNVLRSDITDSFIEYNKKNGKNIKKIDILNIDINENFDFIWINAVLLHFTHIEVKNILLKINSILQTTGILSFTLKAGSGEGLIKEKINGYRFYKYWETQELIELLNSVGLNILYLNTVNENMWIHVICKKKN